MSLLERIQNKKQSLRPVDVNILLENGLEIVERRNSDGSFIRVENRGETSSAESIDPSDPQIINRERKKPEYKQLLGFVVRDLELAKVTEEIFLGSQDVAAELKLLKGASITHIVNCAKEVKDSFPKHFEYLDLEILDLPESKLEDYFQKAQVFISNAIMHGGKVFVHCNAGLSRAPSIVIMYLIKQGMKFEEAFDLVKSKRAALKPNSGFLQQLQRIK